MSLTQTNVLYITYNSTLTGSKALRKLNEFKCVQNALYTNKNSNMVSSVPLVEDNTDYKAIQQWIAEGNTVIDNPPE